MNRLNRIASHVNTSPPKTILHSVRTATSEAQPFGEALKDAIYNPEWNPNGIEGGVDTNKLPWIPLPHVQGMAFKPLRVSKETGMFSVVMQMKKGTVQPDTAYLGAADFMVLSGKMTYGTGPLAGTVEPGVWGYIPGGARVQSVAAEEDCEYLMNFHGPAAFLESGKTKGLFTGPDVAAAAQSRGITLVPNTLGECMSHHEKSSTELKGEPLAISRSEAASLCTGAEAIANKGSTTTPHFVDTKALPWIDGGMPGLHLKIMRVSAETGIVSAMVRQNGQAVPHYHLGASDFMMLSGRIGYRAGPAEGYGPGMWFYEPAGARHEATQRVKEDEDLIYLANIYGPIQFDSGVGTPVEAVLSWMTYLEMAKAAGSPLVKNTFEGSQNSYIATAI
jgi:quercetin dioxygenase-like cupin family protein